MHKSHFAQIIRWFSLLNIFLSVFLFSVSRKQESMIIPENVFRSSKTFSYAATVLDKQKPQFDSTIISLFPENRGNKTTETSKEIKISTEQTAIPVLTFIGIVVTDNKKIYSFKDTHDNSLLFLEKGVKINDITLIDDNEAACILKIKNLTFKVDKR